MNRFSFFAALTLCMVIAGAAVAVPPSNGYIGVFGDATGTDCCITLNGGGNGRMYVFAVTGGGSADGIAGAEFKISIEPPAPNAVITWDPAAGVAVSTGNPIDNGNGGGGFVVFDGCQTQTGLAGDKILLGEINVWDMDEEHRLVVRRSDTTTNGTFACPSVLLCDAPAYTQVCLTLESGDPALGGEDPLGFVSVVNSQDCSGASCGFVSVQAETWSTIKDLYR